MRKPTEAQAQLIKYFADGTKPTARTTRQTYARCEAEGWIVYTEEFPYHEATDAGRRAAGLPVEPVREEEFPFISNVYDNGKPVISLMGSSKGTVRVNTPNERHGYPPIYVVKEGLSHHEAADYVRGFRETYLAQEYVAALEMDRARVVSYRYPWQGGTGERTLYANGDQIFQFGTGIEVTELYAAMGSPEMVMRTMVAIRNNVMEQAHADALEEGANHGIDV